MGEHERQGPAGGAPAATDGGFRPAVLDQRPGPPGFMQVTFSMPSLRRATVTLPLSAWEQGEHLTVPPIISRLLDRATMPPAPDNGANLPGIADM